MTKLIQIAAALLLLNSPLAYADPLDDAKDAGQVGEQANGYIGLVSASAPAAVAELVKDINTKRRAEYNRIAEKNNLTIAQVEALAGRKRLNAPPAVTG